MEKEASTTDIVTPRQEILLPDIAIVANTVMGALIQKSEAEKHAADKHAEVEMAKIQLETGRLAALVQDAQNARKFDIAGKFFLLAFVSGVVFGGFYTGRIEIVGYVLSAISCVFGGYGFALTRKK
jgi:hypothetical protein